MVKQNEKKTFSFFLFCKTLLLILFFLKIHSLVSKCTNWDLFFEKCFSKFLRVYQILRRRLPFLQVRFPQLLISLSEFWAFLQVRFPSSFLWVSKSLSVSRPSCELGLVRHSFELSQHLIIFLYKCLSDFLRVRLCSIFLRTIRIFNHDVI